MKLELLILRHGGLIAREGYFKPKVIIPARNFGDGDGNCQEDDDRGCQDYAMGVLELPQYFWDVSGDISTSLRNGEIPELIQRDRLEVGSLVAFHRKEKFDYYPHYGIVRKRRKRNHSPWLFVIESRHLYSAVKLHCIEELRRYGNYVDIYRKTDEKPII